MVEIVAETGPKPPSKHFACLRQLLTVCKAMVGLVLYSILYSTVDDSKGNIHSG